MKARRWAQFNIRIDADLLDEYREHCQAQAIDPHGYIIKHIERMVREKPAFMDRMWKEFEKELGEKERKDR